MIAGTHTPQDQRSDENEQHAKVDGEEGVDGDLHQRAVDHERHAHACTRVDRCEGVTQCREKLRCAGWRSGLVLQRGVVLV